MTNKVVDSQMFFYKVRKITWILCMRNRPTVNFSQISPRQMKESSERIKKKNKDNQSVEDNSRKLHIMKKKLDRQTRKERTNTNFKFTKQQIIPVEMNEVSLELSYHIRAYLSCVWLSSLFLFCYFICYFLNCYYSVCFLSCQCSCGCIRD